jgi:hypothetical protein
VLVGEETWRYAWPPILDCQNIPVPNEFWGESDIPDDIIHLAQSRNFALSNWARIVKYQAHKRLNTLELIERQNGLIRLNPELLKLIG